MKTDKQIIGVRGVLVVADIVNSFWKSDWQKMDSENDDGIDGIIHIRKHGELTGETIYAQVKSGNGYMVVTKNRPEFIGVNLGADHLKSHRPRWNSLRGAVILVFVDDDKQAYWTNLKSDKSYTDANTSIVLIPKSQRFGSHSKGDFKRIGDFFPQDRHLTTIRLTKADLGYLRIDKPIKECARQFYRSWANEPSSKKNNVGLGEVKITRCGWRHISRKKRGYDKIFQSWQLLSAARKMIQTVDKAYQITKLVSTDETDDHYILKDFISLRAKIIFPNRHESVVQVILRRKRIINKGNDVRRQDVWFYSVYEPRRGIRLQ